MTVDKSPSSILILCESLYRSNRQSSVDLSHDTMCGMIKDGLTAFLRGMAILHEGLFPSWKADARHPGYLVRVDAPAVMRAPYHLVPAVPSDMHLEAIWQISRSIKTVNDSIICLSGSGALLKSSLLISDFDFCEYISSPLPRIIDAFLSKDVTRDNTIFDSMKFGSRSWDDLTDESLKFELQKMNPNIELYSYAKFDFFARAPGFRPIDVSNVVIICDENFKSASMSRTFSAQEAHFDAAVAVPNELGDPMEIGRYIFWLRGQIYHCIENYDYCKSLKRSLSLSRVCFLSDIAGAITSYISISADFLLKEVASIDGLIAALQRESDQTRHLWIRELIAVRFDIIDKIEALGQQDDNKPIELFAKEIAARLSKIFGNEARAA